MIGIEWCDGYADAVTVGDRVDVKLDLSRKNCGVWWAVTALQGAHKGKVVARVRGCELTGVTARVTASTQARWMNTRRKPCAWLRGTLAADGTAIGTRERVTFDFHSGRPEFFYAADGSTFTAAPAAVFTTAAYAVN